MPSSRLKLKRKVPNIEEKAGTNVQKKINRKTYDEKSLPKRKVLSAVMDHSATNTKNVVVEKQNDIYSTDKSINMFHKSNFAVPNFLFSTMPLSAPSFKKQKRFRNSTLRNHMYSSNNPDEHTKHQKIHSKSTSMIRAKVGKFTKETMLYEMNAEPWTALRWPNIKSLLSNKTMNNTEGMHLRSDAPEPSSSTTRLTPQLKRSCLDDKGFLINKYVDGWKSIFGSNRPTPVLVWSKLQRQLNNDNRNKNIDLNQIIYDNHVDKNKNKYKKNTILEVDSSTISSRSGDVNYRDNQNRCEKTYLYKRAPLIQRRSQKR
eukprot:g6427.t1